jgi:hypothetical protein
MVNWHMNTFVPLRMTGLLARELNLRERHIEEVKVSEGQGATYMERVMRGR